MHQHQAVLGMVHGVADLLGGQTHVDRVQHGADHRHGKEALQCAVTVPVEQGHGIARFDSGLDQHIGQALDTLHQGRVGVAQLVGVDDFLTGLITHAGKQQTLDQQRIAIGPGCRGNDAGIDHRRDLHS
ncbi:hypothetical protein D3C84_790660 [compost metagenome]